MIPIQNEKAETVARALHKHIFATHGYPKMLLSDRAKSFVGKGLRWLGAHLGVAKVNTAGLAPTAASSVERTHRGLNASLTMVCNEARDDWDLQVDAVLFAHRISINEATGYSPAFLALGRRPRIPLAIVTGLEDAATMKGQDQYVRTMVESLQAAFGHVRQQQREVLDKNYRRQLGLNLDDSEERVEEALEAYTLELKEGDLVMLWEPQKHDKTRYRPKKLSNRYTGPWPVLRQQGSHYWIRRRGKEMMVHGNRLRHYQIWKLDPFAAEEGQDISQASQASIPPSERQGPKRGREGEPTPQIGEMAVIVQTGGNAQQAAPKVRVGKIVNKQEGNLVLHWYGNYRGQMDGTYQKGWLEAVGKRARENRRYYFKNKPNTVGCTPYTTQEVGETVSERELVCWGFQLTYSDKLPLSVNIILHEDERVAWKMEVEQKEV